MEDLNTQGFSFDLPKGNSSIIKVIGVGGGGNNALKHMYEKGIHGVDFVICNTDAQTLDNNPVSNKVQLGVSITEGLGAGADPEVGEKAAIESIDDIKAALGQNTKMVFITAGMGGGTGTGAAPVIAKVAKETGVLTVGIVTVPFSFEGKRRLEQAELGLEKLRNNVDSLIVINNDKLRQQFGNLGFKQGFSKADEVLTNAAKGMAEVITGYFDVNIDFRDAKSVLQNSGTALMSTGTATGENKAEEAVKKALDSPLLNDNKITGAKNVLLLIRSGNEEATMDEIGLINDYIQREAGNTADIIFGVGTDEELGDAISVLVIATGFAKDNLKTTGHTEKIKYNLHGSERSHRESPFKTKAEKQESEPENLSGKSFFRLDDEEDTAGPQFKETSVRNVPVEQPAQTEVQYYEEDDNPQEEEEYNLFSYSDFDEEPQSISFTFDVEDKPKAAEETHIAEEKPVEISFSVNEPAEEPGLDFHSEEVSFEIKEEPVSPKHEEAPQPAQNFYQEMKKEAPAAEVKHEEPAAAKTDASQVAETHEEFTFISKPAPSVHDQKVQERRNKLKEFNSRYQVYDTENDFETVPAFRRKNINIETPNVSDQNINSFLSENSKGEIQVRENRFLNKDVD
ncbi:cell division protein FtsZ [Weeksellaceae bacterium A-14]